MEATQLNELAGRIEGIGRTLLLFINEAAEEGVIERHDFIARLRQIADALDVENDPLLSSAQKTMHRGADYLEQRRT